MIRIIFIYFIIFIAGGNLYPQDKNDNIVDLSISSVPDTVNKNYFTIFININIKEGWHLNSNKPYDDYLSPTAIRLKDSSGIKIVCIEYPPEMISKLQFSESDLSLYEGMITIKVILQADNVFLKEKKKVKLELDYQSCNNQTCLFPVQKILTIDI